VPLRDFHAAAGRLQAFYLTFLKLLRRYNHITKPRLLNAALNYHKGGIPAFFDAEQLYNSIAAVSVAKKSVVYC
jgi:hypothetical protein